MFPTVQRRILVRLIPLLALLFICGIYWVGRSLETTLYAAHLETARQSSLMAVFALETSMISDDRHRPWDLVAREIPQGEGPQIEIVGREGRVVFSSNSSRVGVVHDRADPICVACHATASAPATDDAVVVDDPASDAHLIFAAPLRNAERCRSCHGPQERKLGMVLVRQSLEPVRAQIRAMQGGLAVIGGLTLLAIVLTTHLLLGRYLGRPLGRLVAGAREIGAGNLSHRIETDECSELALLAQTLNSSTTRLARLQEELVQQERLAAVGETVAGLAHCLKNLLNGLRAGQYVIDRAVETGDENTLRKGWGVMKNAVGEVENLTSDMLYYIKKREPERESTDPNAVARDVVELLERQAAAQDVELRTELDPAIGREQLDRRLVYRALLNLVSNAIDACTESENGNLVVVSSALEGDAEIVLSVRDNGVGMSEETRSMLFTKFFSTKAGRGTGLGLSVVSKIATEHGGTVEVESEEDHGSIFRLRLPRTPKSTG